MPTYQLPIPAKPKARPRVTRNGTFMPKDYQDWRREFANELVAAGAVLLDKPCAITISAGKNSTSLEVHTVKREHSRSGLLTGDVDNYLGGIMDAVKGILYLDDRQVHEATIRLH